MQAAVAVELTFQHELLQVDRQPRKCLPYLALRPRARRLYFFEPRQDGVDLPITDRISVAGGLVCPRDGNHHLNQLVRVESAMQ
jgi:hypothetical protein